MKKLMIGLLLLSFAFTTMAGQTYTCKDLYKMKAQAMADKMDEAGNAAEAAFLGSIAGVIASTEVPPIFLISFMSALTFYTAAHVLQDLHKKYENRAEFINVVSERFYKKVMRKNPNVTRNQIYEILEQGFESGDFCKSYDLMSAHQIKNYVRQSLK